MRKFMGWLAGILATVIAGFILYQLTYEPPTPPMIIDRPAPQLRDLSVRMDAPRSIGVGDSAPVRVEVLSGPNSPISGAQVTIEVGGGSFRRSGQRVTQGQTNAHGFFADTWTSPPGSSGITYLVTATISKRGFETASRRIKIMVR
jgi:hypothetical protein